MVRRGRIAQANAAVEYELEGYSDEDDQEFENNDELDTSSRLKQPVSYNRSLVELYRILFIYSFSLQSLSKTSDI